MLQPTGRYSSLERDLPLFGNFHFIKKSKLRVLHPEQALINVKTGSGRKMGSFYERRFLRCWPQLFRVSWNMDTKCLNIIVNDYIG